MKKHSNYRLDIIPGVVIALFSLWYMSMIPGIQTFTGMGSTPLTNHFVPYLWGCALLVLAAWLIIRGLRKRAAFVKNGGKLEKLDFKAGVEDKMEVIQSFVLMALYVALMGPVGFVPCTVVYLFLQILVLTPKENRKKTYVPAVICSVVCACLFYYLFRYHLNVLLPQGILKSFGI